MRRATLPIVVALICILLMIFYLIPGISHPFVSQNPTASHLKHAVLFAGLAVLSLVWARFSVNTSRA